MLNGYTTAEFISSGDFEDVTQADLNEKVVYIMAEAQNQIREYDVSTYETITLNHTWDITTHVPTYDGSGPEGIAFVPDNWLDYYNFVDRNGNPYTIQGDMGGLMFIAHQNGGKLYAFDLNRGDGSFTYVGSYETRQIESSDLEFNRSTGRLYVWHNTGPNYLEVTELSSYLNLAGVRCLTPVAEFFGPKGGNLEGIGISFSDHWWLITDDDAQNGYGVMWFKSFNPTW